MKDLIAARNAVAKEICDIDAEIADLKSKLHREEQMMADYRKQLNTLPTGKSE